MGETVVVTEGGDEETSVERETGKHEAEIEHLQEEQDETEEKLEEVTEELERVEERLEGEANSWQSVQNWVSERLGTLENKTDSLQTSVERLTSLLAEPETTEAETVVTEVTLAPAPADEGGQGQKSKRMQRIFRSRSRE